MFKNLMVAKAALVIALFSTPAIGRTLPLNTLVGYNLGSQVVIGSQVYPQVKLGNGQFSLYGQGSITFSPGAGIATVINSDEAYFTVYSLINPYIEIIPQYFQSGPNVPICFAQGAVVYNNPSATANSIGDISAQSPVGISTFQQADGWHVRFIFTDAIPNPDPGYDNTVNTYTINFMCPPKVP